LERYRAHCFYPVVDDNPKRKYISFLPVIQKLLYARL
jgi:hypothetical protein